MHIETRTCLEQVQTFSVIATARPWPTLGKINTLSLYFCFARVSMWAPDIPAGGER